MFGLLKEFIKLIFRGFWLLVVYVFPVVLVGTFYIGCSPFILSAHLIKQVNKISNEQRGEKAPLWWRIPTALIICYVMIVLLICLGSAMGVGILLSVVTLLGYGGMSVLLIKFLAKKEAAEKKQVLVQKPYKTSSPAMENVIDTRFHEVLSDSLQLMETTVYPKTFFSRYDLAISTAEQFLDTTRNDQKKTQLFEVLDDLKCNREEKIIAFVDRCHEAGKLDAVRNELLSGEYDIPPVAIAYIKELLMKMDAETLETAVNGEYIYCSLSFEEGGKTYFYKTEDETLKCGDEVIVPVGNNGRKGIARIEKIERFKIGETPYPPNRTKTIFGKCEY